jgi:hypothetical protein
MQYFIATRSASALVARFDDEPQAAAAHFHIANRQMHLRQRQGESGKNTRDAAIIAEVTAPKRMSARIRRLTTRETPFKSRLLPSLNDSTVPVTIPNAWEMKYVAFFDTALN